MSSLSSILSLSSKKLVLENFHLFCYILSYVETPLSVKMVHFLLQINKYYNTLINKLLSHHSFSNIFPVRLLVGDLRESLVRMDTRISILVNTISSRYGSNTSGNSNSMLSKGINIIEWNYENYRFLSKEISYEKYKNLFDYIILSSSMYTSSNNIASNNSSTNTNNRMIDQIILSTTNDNIIKYTLQNLHKTKVKHFCLINRDYSYVPSTSTNRNINYDRDVVNYHLHTVKFNCHISAVDIGKFLTSCKFDKLHHIEIIYFDKELTFTGNNMPLLTSLNLYNCTNLNFDQHIKSNLLTLKINNVHHSNFILDNMVNLTNLELNLAYANILPGNSIHSLTNLTSLEIMCRNLPHDTFIDMNKLKTLILPNFSDSINGLFDNLISLTHLEIPYYTHHYHHEEVLPSLPNLTYVKVRHCDKVKVSLFQNLSNLKELSIIAYHDKLAIGIEKSLINLTSLHVSNTVFFIEKSILANIANYSCFTTLILKCMNIKCMNIVTNNSLVNPLSTLVNLTELSFSECQLAGKLEDVKNLQKLCIKDCKGRNYFNSPDLKDLIENCVKLKHLILYDPPPLNDALFTLLELEIIEFQGEKDFSIDRALIKNLKLKSIIFGKRSRFDGTFHNNLQVLINLHHLYLPPKYSQPLPFLLQKTNIYVNKNYPCKEYLNNHPADKIFYYE